MGIDRMPEPKKKLPPAHQERAKRLEAAFDAFTREMDLLRKERHALKQRFLKRIESGKIDDIKKLLRSL